MTQKFSRKKHAPAKVRGKLLTTLISLDLLGILFLLTRVGNPQMLQMVYGGSYFWMITSLLVRCGILLGLFYWKRVAVYGFFLFAILSLAVHIPLWYTHQSYGLTVTVCIAVILYSLIWLWAIKRKWQLFS